MSKKLQQFATYLVILSLLCLPSGGGFAQYNVRIEDGDSTTLKYRFWGESTPFTEGTFQKCNGKVTLPNIGTLTTNKNGELVVNTPKSNLVLAAKITATQLNAQIVKNLSADLTLNLSAQKALTGKFVNMGTAKIINALNSQRVSLGDIENVSGTLDFENGDFLIGRLTSAAKTITNVAINLELVCQKGAKLLGILYGIGSHMTIEQDQPSDDNRFEYIKCDQCTVKVGPNVKIPQLIGKIYTNGHVDFIRGGLSEEQKQQLIDQLVVRITEAASHKTQTKQPIVLIVPGVTLDIPQSKNNPETAPKSSNLTGKPGQHGNKTTSNRPGPSMTPTTGLIVSEETLLLPGTGFGIISTEVITLGKAKQMDPGVGPGTRARTGRSTSNPPPQKTDSSYQQQKKLQDQKKEDKDKGATAGTRTLARPIPASQLLRQQGLTKQRNSAGPANTRTHQAVHPPRSTGYSHQPQRQQGKKTPAYRTTFNNQGLQGARGAPRGVRRPQTQYQKSSYGNSLHPKTRTRGASNPPRRNGLQPATGGKLTWDTVTPMQRYQQLLKDCGSIETRYGDGTKIGAAALDQLRTRLQKLKQKASRSDLGQYKNLVEDVFEEVKELLG